MKLNARSILSFFDPGVGPVARLIRGARRNLRRAHQRQVPRSAGFALLVVTVTVAILAAVVNDFGYNARVDFESAANARDQLRAEYIARSGINLSRILIKVQTSVLDKMNNLGQAAAGMGLMLPPDLQISQFAPYLLGAFLGDDSERQAAGEMFGGGMKGTGLGKGASGDVVFDTEDGKININCAGGVGGNSLTTLGQLPPTPPPGGGPPPNSPLGMGATSRAALLYQMLYAVMFPQRYNRMFENMTSDGQYVTRQDVASAIIDWTDLDESKFDPMQPQGGGGSEDYRYDAGRDPYKARNNYFDTVEEVNLVRGVGDDFYGAFGSLFTVYGRCQVNLKAVSQENWPIGMALYRVAAKNPQDPVLLDDIMMSALSQQTQSLMQWLPQQSLLQSLPGILGAGGRFPNMPGAGQSAMMPDPMFAGLSLTPLQLNPSVLGKIARVGPREVYRIESTGTVKRAGDRKIQVRIRAIWDTQHPNQNIIPSASGPAPEMRGTWLYWRME